MNGANLLEVGPARLRLPNGWQLDLAGLQMRAGEIARLEGPNGSGKSLFLRTLAGLARTHRGRVCFRGHDIGRWPADRRARAGLCYVPQSRNLHEALTIGENAFLAHRWLGHREGGSPPSIDSARLREVLASPEGMLIHLSGGERQVLAMELTGRSANRLIMLDEPFAFLSRSGGELLTKYINLLASSHGVSFIITDHTGLFNPTAAVSLYQISNGTLKAAQ